MSDTDAGIDADDEQATDVATIEQAPDSPGIYQISDETYHGGPGFSRSQLWKLWDQTPHHARYGERKETDPQKMGRAAHVAVLEPNTFEGRHYRGPDDRRGKKWDAAKAIAREAKKVCLTSDEYETALRLRDAAHRHRTVQKITRGTPAIEQSAYYIDQTTGELLKVRPDIYSYDLRIMADLKAVANANSRSFQKSIAEYGYHLQRFMYALGWEEAGGPPVDGFVFICIEKPSPNAIKIYEIEQDATDEARDVYRIAVDNWHLCAQGERNERRANEQRRAIGKGWDDTKLERHIERTCWPSYPANVERIDLPAHGYKVRPRT